MQQLVKKSFRSTREILDYLGGDAHVALRIGKSPFAVRGWRYRGIPEKFWPWFVKQGISIDDLMRIK